MMVVINGRKRYFYSLENIKKLRRGHWTVRHRGTGETYTIEGGKSAGGTRREWFVSHPQWRKPISATSLVDALNILEGM